MATDLASQDAWVYRGDRRMAPFLMQDTHGLADHRSQVAIARQ
jgi:hypothetical protein